jgi:hypothetical protein
MLHHHTVWNLMRKYTQRQVEPDSVDDVCIFLEEIVRYIVEESEKLLKYNGTKTSRISCDCVRPILNSRRNITFAAINGRRNKQKKKIGDKI